MRCEDVRLELAAVVTGREEPPAGVLRHVAGCPRCARERDALAETVGLLASISTPRADLREETIAAASSDDVARLVRTAVPALPPEEFRAKVLAASTAGGAVVPLRVGRRKGAVWSAAAVTVAAVVSLAWWGLRGDGPGEAGAFASIPRGHDLVEVTLRGETEAQATLTHYRHDNYRLTLSTAGYDVTPPGYQYAVWLRGHGGEVPLGGFRLKHEDVFTIPFAIAVDPARYPEIVVTLEPVDGEPAMTGTVVSSARLDAGSVHHGEYDE